MRKFIFSSVMLLLCSGLFAQNATAAKNKQLSKALHKMSDVSYVYQDAEIGSPIAGPVNTSAFYMAKTRVAGTTVGTSTYGLGSNGSPASRLIAYTDGKISAVFTGSSDGSSAYADRGTWYNYYDGSTWGAEPTERIESIRTGFGQLILVGTEALGAEMTFAHTGSNTIKIYASVPQSNVWTEMPASETLTGTWCRAACAEGSSYVHVISADFPPAALTTGQSIIYNRSSDGGVTWDILNQPLEFMTSAEGYAISGSESYQIKAEGNNVYIVAGESVNDLAVWKSTSNGDAGSWTRTRIIDFPIENFDGNIISDVDGDLVADTIGTTDGAVSILVDNDGMMHVWAGVTNILDVTAGDNSWSYFPGVTGMWYWNESFGEDSVQYLDLMIDWDDDGDRFAGIGVDIPNYGIGLTSQPTPTLDPATGNIYVMFAQPVENTDYAEDPTADGAQSFRDLFGIYTTDGGQSWSGEINLTYVAHNNYENLYISTTSTTEGDKVHALWWQDQEPGNAFETPTPDAIGPHSIVCNGWDFSRFEPYDPSADFSFFIPDPGVTGEVEFTNASADADSYAWNFGDGGSSSSINPSHDYAEGGDYNVCLTAENHYGSNVSCKTVTVTDFVGIEDIALNKALQIFPSPSNGNVNVAINNDNFHSATVEVFNMLGESVMNAITMNVNANNTMALDLTSVAEGNYVVKVLGDNGGIAVRQLTIAH